MPTTNFAMSAINKLPSRSSFFGLLSLAAIASLLLFFYRFNMTFQKLFTSHKLSIVDICRERDNWPDLELFLTVPPDGDGAGKYWKYFVPSVSLFWPAHHLKLLLVTDVRPFAATMQFAREALGQLQMMTEGRSQLKYAYAKDLNSLGWHKSQWLKFWADNFTESEFVGFVDSDAFFVSRVTRADLFVGNKPIVRPIYGKPKRADFKYWSRVPENTYKYTGYKEPFNCMSYFPIIVRTKHIPHFRNVLQAHIDPNIWFDVNFRDVIIRGGYYSEFNIMCAIMWNDFRDEYHWIVDESEVGWTSNISGQASSLAEAGVTREMLHAQPRVAIHPNHDVDVVVINAERQGVCFSMTDQEPRPAYCSYSPNRTLNINNLEFEFETDTFINRSGTFESHIKRIRENDACLHPWLSNRLNALLVGNR